jgi:surfeit locus 1 family protein
VSTDRRFRQGLFASVAAALGIAVTLSAGVWQMNRADEKEHRQARLETLRREPPVSIPAERLAEGDFLYRRVRISGTFAPEHTVYLDNRVRRGVAGFEIVTPLRIGASERFVAVNRGWLAGRPARDVLPEVQTPPGQVTVEGTVVPAQRVYVLDRAEATGKVWLGFSMGRMKKESGLDLEPILVQQESTLEDGLERVWDRPDSGREKHLAYAFQWFAMAFAILVIYVVLGFRRPPTPHGQA